MAQADVPVQRTSRIHLGWMGIGGLAVVVALVGGLVGYYIKANQSAPANPDQALANDLAAAWSTTYDTAKVVPLYTSNATFHDMIVNETTTGLANIQAKVSAYIAQGFNVTNTSAPIREGDFVAWFGTYESTGQAAAPVLNVVSLSDGKIVDQWVYPAP